MLGKKVEYFEATYHEFDTLVKAAYGIDYEFCADNETPNDTNYRFSAKKKELSKYEIDKLEGFKRGEYVPYMAHILFQDWANRDIIQEGDYLITVSW
jgi:hypothetical protein